LIAVSHQNFDQHKRALSSGGEAQVSGTVATFQLERSLRNGGSGFGASDRLGCTVNASDGGTPFTFPLVPVRIVDGAGGAPDQVAVLSGSSTSPSSTYVVQSTDAGQTLLDSRGGLEVDDLAVITQAAPGVCRLLHISAVTPAGTGSANPLVLHAAGFGRYSGATAIVLPFQAVDSTIHNLGKTPTLTTWTVNNNTLVAADRLSNHDPNSWGDVVDGVVDLQAEYGLDTDGDTRIDTWQAADPADWTTLRLIRFALLIRGQARQSQPVTTVAPSWAGGDFVMRNVDGTADSGLTGAAANNWRYYRYQVQEASVPLRNVIWRNAW
jgi:type IV pilus assembly protein PilW